ncbi:STAS domain-containing protein [Streptomyces sp. NPDC096136]|uniref:STAS domain-containing protein n=1 Tax=Streptomyces sp. NPDC096136 TaxID=3366076 RepID=UPI00380F439A
MESPRVTVGCEADGTCVITCAGRFDADAVALLVEACETSEPADALALVVDVSGVTFADSSFLDGLVHLGDARRLVLQGPVPLHLERLLQTAGARDVFDFRDAPEAG